MEARLECYKNYLLHLQSVIEILEREIRGLKVKEKEHQKLSKIAGVGVQQKHNTHADQLKKKILMLERQIEKELNANAAKEVSPPKKKIKVKAKIFGQKRQSKSSVRTQNAGKDLVNAKTELKDREDQLTLLQDMLRSSAHESQMKDNEIERLQKRLKKLGTTSKGTFKTSNKLKPINKQNKTDNAFLPASLKGSVKAEAGFPGSYKGSGSFSNQRALPSVKGAHQYTDDRTSHDYDDVSQKSQSQLSLAISQKRGERIVNESRRKVNEMEGEEANMFYGRVDSIQPSKRGEEIVNVQIREEDPSLEEGTMRFAYDHPKPIIPDVEENESDYEEGYPDDYNNDDI